MAELSSPEMLGRDTPGLGGDRAARYIAEAFAAAAIEPIRIAAGDHPVIADGRSENEGQGAISPRAPGRAHIASRIDPYFHPFEFGRLKQRVDNVIALVESTGATAEVIVVGAHYDGLGERDGRSLPAADDNASGIAVLIEVAEALRLSEPPPRTVVFVAFGAEEDGLLGARNYVQAQPMPIENTLAMINLDMVGRPQSERLTIVGWERYPELSEMIGEEARRWGLATVGGPRYLWQRSDQFPFAEVGIPSVWLHGYLHRDYHTQRDTPDRLDYAWMLKVANTLLAILEIENGWPEP